VLRVTDVLSQTTMDRIWIIGTRAMACGPQVTKVLIVLDEGLQGNWDDTECGGTGSASGEPGDARIAVLGDPRRKAEALPAPAADRYRGAVVHFLPEERSKAWQWLAA
jgi:hypothetical protein